MALSAGPVGVNPAPGVRNNSEGKLWGVGGYGYSWTSSIPSAADLESRAHYLHFDNTRIAPNAAAHRAVGLQSRCLQE
ncbi:MAG: hypothetical protein K2G93_03505 [Rikenella sp.]|nr:hypothetical protein [Rikenella sp.]